MCAGCIVAGRGSKENLGKRHETTGGESYLISTAADTWAACMQSCEDTYECDFAVRDSGDGNCHMYRGWYASSVSASGVDSFYKVRAARGSGLA